VGLWYFGVALVALAASGQLVADLDMFHQMALIRVALETGVLPRIDVFAFTPVVTPSVHHEWGAGALLYGAAVATGWGGAGILALRYALLSAIVVIACRAAIRRGASGTTMLLCAPLAVLLFTPGLSTLRAQTYTFLLTALLLGFLERDRGDDRLWIGWWLLAYVFWLNVHGGFVVGLGLFGVHMATRFVEAWRTAEPREPRGTAGLIPRQLDGQEMGDDGSRPVAGESVEEEDGVAHGTAFRQAWMGTRHLVFTFLAMAGLIVVNPYGLDYLPFLHESLLLDRPLVDEWAPLWSSRVQVQLQAAFIASLLYPAYAFIRLGSRALPALMLIAAAAVAAIGAQRLVPIYAIVWFICIPGLLTATPIGGAGMALRRFRPMIGILGVVAGTALFTSALGKRPWELRVPNAPLSERSLHYPVGPVAYLEETGFAGNVMTEFNWGAYVSWMLYPAVRVGMDSRYEAAYPPAVVDEIHGFYLGRPGWEEVLDRYGADAVIVRTTRPLAAVMERAARDDEALSWSRVYQDDEFAVWVSASRASALPEIDRRGELIEGTILPEHRELNRKG